MELQRVISILESLGHGIDPSAGTAISCEALQPDDVRNALLAAGAILRNPVPTTTLSPAPRPRPAAAGARWTDAEDAQLCSEHESGMAIPEIARQHQRSRGAITSRLVHLGRLDPATVKVRQR
jgi:hypothetical protein